MEDVANRFGIPEDYTSSAEVTPDDMMPERDAIRIMDEIIATINANTQDFDVSTPALRTSVKEGILLCIAVNGSVTRAHFRHKISCAAGTFEASWISNILGSNIRRFARYYADLTKFFLRGNSKSRADCLRKYGYDEDPTLSFDCAQYCSGLSAETKVVLAKLGKERLSRSANYDPATLQATAGNTADVPRVSMRRTHDNGDDLA